MLEYEKNKKVSIMWSAITGWPKILPGGVKKSKKLKFAGKLDEFNSTFGFPKKIFTYHYKVLRYFFKFQDSIYALKKIFVEKNSGKIINSYNKITIFHILVAKTKSYKLKT